MCVYSYLNDRIDAHHNIKISSLLVTVPYSNYVYTNLLNIVGYSRRKYADI